MRRAEPGPDSEILRKMYIDQGMSTAKIGQHFGKSYSTARKWLLEAGVQLRSPSSKTPYGEAQKRHPGNDILRQMYTGRGMTLRAIATELSVGYGKVREWIIQAGIPLRYDNARRYPIEPLLNFFSEPSENLWYFLGYFYADGNMSEENHRISISSVDKEHLTKVFAATGYIGSVITCQRPAPSRPIHVINAHGKNVYNALTDFGLAPNKSKTMQFPNVPNKFLGDFVRGHFDGDGSIIVQPQKPQSMTFRVKIASGSESFIRDLQGFLAKRNVTPTHIHQQGATSILQFSAHKALLTFAKLMYAHCPALYMERKWRQFAMLLGYVGMIHPSVLT